MWWKIILILFILANINGYWDDKYAESRTRYKDRRKRRLYRFLKGLTYLTTAGISLLIIDVGGGIIYLYTILGIVFAIGSFLSAINCNLRNIYNAILVIGLIIWAISPHFNNHKIIFSIIDIYLVIAIICAVKEGIENIYYGVDPDLEEEEKEEINKWKCRFKVVKLLVKIWF